MTMTFVGFQVDDKGQCQDFKSKKLIKDCRVPVKVCECLATQGVHLQGEDCNMWTKYVKHAHNVSICNRMGCCSIWN